MPYKPVVLIILDGFGRGPAAPSNAIWVAKKPFFDYIEANFPVTNLQASGIAVGLPWGEEGNSEVGHLNLGSGRIVYQYLPRIVFAIRDGSFYQNPAMLGAVQHVKKNKSALHVIGLVSSGSVHAYIDHFYAVLELAKRQGISNINIHVFTDGRDTPLKEAINFLEKVNQKVKNDYPGARIADIVGRYYAMDRDDHWNRTQEAYNLITKGEGEKFTAIADALKAGYAKGLTDEFIEPSVIASEGQKPATVGDNDAVIFINFREDSPRQLTEAFVGQNFDKFQKDEIKNLYFATMTKYKEELETQVAFEPLKIKNPLAEVLVKAGKKQFHIAETEKYAHITYFFNGGIEKQYESEERVLISSVKDYKFAERPEMSAPEITDKIIEAVNSGKYDFVVANFANADMVGHSGDFNATVKAIEILDEQIGLILNTILKTDAAMIITADHGNADEERNPLTGEPYPEHSANPVPFYLIASAFARQKTQEQIEREKMEIGGILADVSPTILELMGMPISIEMTGHSLLKFFGIKI